MFPLNLVYLKKVVNVIIFLSVVYFFCDVIFIKTLLASDGEVSQKIVENFTKILAIPCGFVLLNIIYHKDKQKGWAVLGKLWVVFIIALGFLLAAIRARRGLMFMTGNILLLTYLLYNYATKINLVFKFLPLLIIFFLIIYTDSIYSNRRASAFTLIKERINEDTRSDVEDYFLS